MQRIVIDTNVFVSSLIQRGYPYLIVNHLFIDRKIDLCISNEVLREYYEVLSREKFKKHKDFFDKAESLLADIEIKSFKYFPTSKINLISDKDDNKLLELAQECKADFLITGNTNDFTMKSYKNTFIVTPMEYWESHKP